MERGLRVTVFTSVSPHGSPRSLAPPPRSATQWLETQMQGPNGWDLCPDLTLTRWVTPVFSPVKWGEGFNPPHEEIEGVR